MQAAVRSSLLFFVVLGAACDRLSEEACRAAVDNVRRIVTEDPNARAAPSDIEQCRENDDAEEVACNRAAKTVEGLFECQRAAAQRLAATH